MWDEDAQPAAAVCAGMQPLLSPTREAALDRWANHTAICPSSRQAFEVATNLGNVLAVSAAIEAGTVLAQFQASGPPPMDSLLK